MVDRRPLLPVTTSALHALGAQVAAGRRQRGWTAAELADRVGVGRAVIGRIEAGDPGTAVGTVLEAAVVCGVELFDVAAADLPEIARRAERDLALLPRRVRPRAAEVDDDF